MLLYIVVLSKHINQKRIYHCRNSGIVSNFQEQTIGPSPKIMNYVFSCEDLCPPKSK